MDIQDLLDEVEEVIQDRPSKSKQTGYGDAASSRSSGYTSSRGDDSYRGVSSASSSSSRTKSTDNIDDLLSMLEGGDDSPRTAAVHPRQGLHSGVSYTTTPSTKAEEFHVTSGSKKCSTAMLGGESAKRGANTAFLSHNVCANLRCNECDFTVVQFVGKKWSSSADYMFFRENVPNEAKLRARMEAAPGSAAYACQCKWLSIDVQTRVDMCRVKWSCAGH